MPATAFGRFRFIRIRCKDVVAVYYSCIILLIVYTAISEFRKFSKSDFKIIILPTEIFLECAQSNDSPFLHISNVGHSST